MTHGVDLSVDPTVASQIGKSSKSKREAKDAFGAILKSADRKGNKQAAHTKARTAPAEGLPQNKLAMPETGLEPAPLRAATEDPSQGQLNAVAGRAARSPRINGQESERALALKQEHAQRVGVGVGAGSDTARPKASDKSALDAAQPASAEDRSRIRAARDSERVKDKPAAETASLTPASTPVAVPVPTPVPVAAPAPAPKSAPVAPKTTDSQPSASASRLGETETVSASRSEASKRALAESNRRAVSDAQQSSAKPATGDAAAAKEMEKLASRLAASALASAPAPAPKSAGASGAASTTPATPTSAADTRLAEEGSAAAAVANATRTRAASGASAAEALRSAQAAPAPASDTPRSAKSNETASNPLAGAGAAMAAPVGLSPSEPRRAEPQTVQLPRLDSLPGLSASPAPGLDLGRNLGLATLSATPSLPYAREVLQQASLLLERSAKGGVTHAQLVLHPEALGSIEVRLSFQDGGVHATMIAQQFATSEALNLQLEQLRSQMEAAGVNLLGLDVRSQEGQQHEAGSSEKAAKTRRLELGLVEEPTEAEAALTPTTPARGSRQLDLMA